MIKKHLFNFFSAFVFLGLVSANFAQGQTRPYRVADRQVLTVLTRIETNTDIYKQQANNALRRGVLSNGDTQETFSGYLAVYLNFAVVQVNNMMRNRQP